MMRNLPVLLTLMLVACGGGSGGSDVQLGGIWLGTGTVSTRPDVVMQAWAISTDAGEFRISTGSSSGHVMILSGEAGQLSGSSVDHRDDEDIPVTWTASLTKRGQVQLTGVAATGEISESVLAYDDTHALGSSMGRVSGTYTSVEGINLPGLSVEYQTTLTIDTLGRLSGADSLSGCVFGGDVRISRYLPFRSTTRTGPGPAVGARDPARVLGIAHDAHPGGGAETHRNPLQQHPLCGQASEDGFEHGSEDHLLRRSYDLDMASE